MKNLNEEIERLQAELAQLKEKQEGILKTLETDNVSYSSLRRGAIQILKFLWSRARWILIALFMAGAISDKKYNWISHILSLFK